MRTFMLTLLAIEILHRAFGDPRTCVTILFWRWILGGLDARPSNWARRAERLTAMSQAPMDQAPFALAGKRATWERRFDLLAAAVAPFAD
jgi:hypothetical protein